MNKELKQPVLTDLCKYFVELAKKYATSKQGELEVSNTEFIINADVLFIRLNELVDFVRIVLSKGIDAPLIKEYPSITYIDYNMKSRFELGNYTQAEFDLVKKVVEKYGN